MSRFRVWLRGEPGNKNDVIDVEAESYLEAEEIARLELNDRTPDVEWVVLEVALS